MGNDVEDFLKEYGKMVQENEPDGTAELMMDDHYFVNHNGVGYYIPKDPVFYTEDDYSIVQYLVEQ